MACAISTPTRFSPRFHTALLCRQIRPRPVPRRRPHRFYLDRQIMEEINNAVEYAAAQRNTSDEDQQIAVGVTSDFRRKEITKDGGSEAVARARWTADGYDFDAKAQRGIPEKPHLALLRQERSGPRFRLKHARFDDTATLIKKKKKKKIRSCAKRSPRTAPPPSEWDKNERLQEKARRGDDFGALAAAQQDSLTWMKNRGYIDVKKDDKGQPITGLDGQFVGVPIQPGTMKLEKLEKPPSHLEPGPRPVKSSTTAKTTTSPSSRKRSSAGSGAFEDDAVQNDISGNACA